MADETRRINVLVDTTRARQNLDRLAADFDNLGSTVGKSDRELIRHDQALVRMSARARQTAMDLRDLRDEVGRQSKASAEARAQIKTLETQLSGWKARTREARAEVKALLQENERLRTTNVKLANSEKTVAKEERGLLEVRSKLAKQFANAKPLQVTPYGISQGGVVPLKQITSGLGGVRTEAEKTSDALESLDKGFHMNALRYAAYDVANSFRTIRDGAIRTLRELTDEGTAFERNFANVIRTTQLDPVKNVQAVNKLRDAFLDLQSTLPVTSEELTRIGTLAAQMGISADRVADFTETVAKFAATSGISADEAATSLARVGQMLDSDVKGDYERLASAILKTGVNAIATEQQIVRGTTQIASVGKVAGLSAQEIVALSSAMSSLGMSPELQRSVVTSSFTRILTAVRGSSAEAEKFGAILNMTGKEFQQAWDNDGYNTYRKLLAAIAQSPNAISILQDLRLSSQRLTPNLLKMGQAYGLLGETLADTTQGWKEDSELQRQYQIIMDTTASKLQVLQQAWDAFLIALGSEGVKVIGELAGSVTNLLKNLRAVADSDAGKFFGALLIGITAVVVAITGLLTAVTLAGAGFLGFSYVQTQLLAMTSLTTGALAGQAAIIRTLDVSMKAATLSVRALNFALKALLPVAIATAGLAIGNWAGEGFRGVANNVNGVTDDIDRLVEKLTVAGEVDPFAGIKNSAGIKDLKGLATAPKELLALNRSLPGLLDMSSFTDVRGTSKVISDLSHLDEKLGDLAEKNPQKAAAYMNQLRDSWQKAGLDAEALNTIMVDTNDALSLQASALGISQDALETYYAGVEDAANAEEKAALQTNAMAEALGLVGRTGKEALDALSEFKSSFSSGMGDFLNFSDMLDDAYGTNAGQGGGLARLQTDLDANLTSATTWADGLQQLFTRGAGSLASAFAAEGPASQQAVADALALGPEALAQLEQSMADAAFFASAAYADAFAEDSAVLAQVYKQMLGIDPQNALDAVHAVREAIRSDGGISPEELVGLQNNYGFKLDVSLLPQMNETDLEYARLNAQAALSAEPVTVPWTLADGSSAIGPSVGWKVFENGHAITLKVHPDTEEGQAILDRWRESQYTIPADIKARVLVDEATAALDQWRATQKQKVLNILVRATAPDLNGSASGSGRPGIATGGLINTRAKDPIQLRGYAGGGFLRGPGTGTSDSILARVSNGEFVMRAAAVRAYGTDFMDRLNRMQMPKFAGGGPVNARGSGTIGPHQVVNVQVTQVNPVTRDPLKQLREDAEMVAAGIWR